MQLPFEELPRSPYTSHLAQAVSDPNWLLGEILAAVARLNTLNQAIAEIRAELAAERARAAHTEKVRIWREARALRLKQSLDIPSGPFKSVRRPIAAWPATWVECTDRVGLKCLGVVRSDAPQPTNGKQGRFAAWVEANRVGIFGRYCAHGFQLGCCINCLELTGAAQRPAQVILWGGPFDPFVTLHPSEPAEVDPKKDRFQKHSRCAECGTQFINEKGEAIVSRFEFCGETSLTQGLCKRTWLAKHKSACYTRPAEYRLTLLTFDGYVARVIPSTRLREQTINTTYRPLRKIGVTAKRQDDVWCETCFDYQQQVHECAPLFSATERERMLQLKQYEATATALHAAGNPPQGVDPRPLLIVDDAKLLAGHRLVLVYADVKHHKAVSAVSNCKCDPRGYPIDTVVRCEVPLQKVIPRPTNQEQLERLFIHPEADFGPRRDIADRGNSAFELIEEGSRQLTDFDDRLNFGSGGGHRVNTAGLPDDGEFNHESSSWSSDRWGTGAKGDRCSRDYRADAIRKARGVSMTNAACKRCERHFALRKGTKYCSDTCRKMHFKEMGQANNLPQQPEL
jgi:hypothetical protein